MPVNIVEELNSQFSFKDGNSELIFKNGPDNIPLLEINNEQSKLSLSLQGAHILSWQPHGHEDVIWLSDDAVFKKGKSIRGGIPICWPWFGAHERVQSFPAHGFARTVFWKVSKIKQLSEDETQITLSLLTKELDQDLVEMWPQNTLLEYKITISNKLTLELTTINNSDEDITIAQALHTYFNIEDISNTKVFGLEGKTYLDKPDDFRCKQQNGAIEINSEVDRVYIDTVDELVIDNNKRNIVIQKQGSHTTVVWNPWEEVANKMGDLGKNGYKKMLCVESANAADDVITIKPANSYTLIAEYKIK